MNYCQRCNGIGYTSLQGDNETLCPECGGSGFVSFLAQLSPEARKRNDEKLETQRLLNLWHSIAPDEPNSYVCQCNEQRDLNELQQYWVKSYDEWLDEFEAQDDLLATNQTYGQRSLDLAEVYAIRQKVGGI